MRVCILTSALCILASIAGGQTQPGLDPKDVFRHVRQVSNPELRLQGRQRQRRVSPTEARARHNSLTPNTQYLTPGLDDGEFMIDTSITHVGAYDGQEDAALAFDGTNYFVTWVDRRDGSDWDIYATRVTPQGTVLDPDGIVVSTATSAQHRPAVAFDGANYLVAWEDGGIDSSWDIYAARVTPRGTVLDPDGIRISPAAFDQYRPAIAFDGVNFLVTWTAGNGANIYAARVTPQGIVLDTSGIPVSIAAHEQSDPALAFDGTNYLVTWNDARSGTHYDIYATRVTPQGAVLDPSGIPISTANEQTSPAIAFDGTNFLVAWEDFRSDTSTDIYAARVTPQGIVLDTSGIPVSTAADYQNYPALAFDGIDFLVTWQDRRNSLYSSDIYAARVTPQGIVLDPDGIPISTDSNLQWSPAIAFDGTGFLVAWEDYSIGNTDIYAARVTPQGAVLDSDGILVSTETDWQWSPASAFDGANFLVTWEDYRSGHADIYATRVTPQGTILDPDGIPVSTAPNDQQTPALAFDGANYLVAWADFRRGLDSSDIYAARVTPQGLVLDTGGIPVSTAVYSQVSPAVAFNDTNFLVTWLDNRRNPSWDIYAARVATGGAVLDPSGIRISDSADYYYAHTAVAFDGTNCLVTWSHPRNGTSDDGIYAARVTPQGIVLDTGAIPVSTEANGQFVPVLAFDGTNYLVTWEDYRSGSNGDIYAARVAPQGSVLDTGGIPISTAADDQKVPAIAFDGANYLVTWEDYRNGMSDIYSAKVTPAGVVFDTGPAVRQAGDQLSPALARGPGNQMFLVYQGWAGTVGGRTYNTDRIWGKFGPFPGVQESPSGEVRKTSSRATIIRGVLWLPRESPEGSDPLGNPPGGGRPLLLDISGRKVLNLSPGPNDVSRLAPGVYFVRGCDDGKATKVVVQR